MNILFIKNDQNLIYKNKGSLIFGKERKTITS